ncbi:MAG: PASTA domain-containing protein [Bacteroidales bacterium]|jgi:beta-lactam-binding protein with PASTA domain|nr:PASTA domain-containing protein [Bacteroidales bacterium]
MDIKSFFKKHPVMGDILKVILLSVCVLIVVILSLRLFTHHGKEYSVPDFSGYDKQQLEDFEENNNPYDFILTINDSVFIPNQKGGVVISQDPPPKMKVKQGRKIYLSLSMEVPPKVEMPNLIDLSLRQAMNMLESNNLKLGQVIYKVSKYPNAVLEQRYKGKIIREGKQIPYQSSITLVVGKEVGQTGLLEENEFTE